MNCNSRRIDSLYECMTSTPLYTQRAVTSGTFVWIMLNESWKLVTLSVRHSTGTVVMCHSSSVLSPARQGKVIALLAGAAATNYYWRYESHKSLPCERPFVCVRKRKGERRRKRKIEIRFSFSHACSRNLGPRNIFSCLKIENSRSYRVKNYFDEYPNDNSCRKSTKVTSCVWRMKLNRLYDKSHGIKKKYGICKNAKKGCLKLTCLVLRVNYLRERSITRGLHVLIVRKSW